MVTAVQDQEPSAGPTPPEEQPIGKLRRAMWGRRLLLLIPFAVVVAALVGALGVRERAVTAEGGGYEVSVSYASTARPGLTLPLDIEVQHDGGFSGPVTIAVAASYLEALDIGHISPEPSESTNDGDVVELTFEPPDGDTLEVTFEVNVDPSAEMGKRRGSVAVVESGEPVVTARFRTWVLP